MKLRKKTNIEICNENNLKYPILTNVVDEESSKNKMLATSELIAKALIATLGPYGSSTIIQDREGKHFASKDGYDLMNRMSFNDEVSRTILDLFRTTASNQVLTVGDGSTSAIVVANALFQKLSSEQIKNEDFKKIAPKDIMDMLNDLSEMVEDKVKNSAIKVSEDMHELDIIATVANNNDKVAGKLVADIYKKIGEYGFIAMDVLDKQPKDVYEIKKGVDWSRGYIDSIFGDFGEDGKIVYSANPRVLIWDGGIDTSDIEFRLIPLMQKACNQEGSEFLIIATDYSEDVETFLKSNRIKHKQLGRTKDPELIFTPVDSIR